MVDVSIHLAQFLDKHVKKQDLTRSVLCIDFAAYLVLGYCADG